jgi:predicted CopG family antitoxin
VDRGTTVKIERETQQKLEKLKIHERQPYDEVIRELLLFFEKNGDGKLPSLAEASA